MPDYLHLVFSTAAIIAAGLALSRLRVVSQELTTLKERFKELEEGMRQLEGQAVTMDD